MIRRFVLTICLTLATALVATSAARASGDSVRTIRVPNAGIHPQAAVDERGRIHLLYVKGDPGACDAFYVSSADGAATFSDPIRVNSTPGSVIVAGTVRGPHLALGRHGRVHVAWMGSAKSRPKAAKEAPLMYARLNDAGDAFEPQRDLSETHPGLDGGGSVAADDAGNVYVVWHAQQDVANPKGEEGRFVWLRRSEDDGKTFGPDVMANPKPTGVCACCGIRVATTREGRVFIAYRSALDSVHRDAQLLRSEDHGKTFAVAASDAWNIGQCVMSTFALTNAGGGDLLAAWETRGSVRVARLAGDGRDGGNAAAPASVPGEGKNRKHPSIAMNAAGESLIAWTEGTAWNKGGSIAWQRFTREGAAIPNSDGRAEGLPAWGVPAAVAGREGAWLIFY